MTYDTATFESLLTPVLGTAYRAALHFTGNAADAEDIVQEAALLALKGFGGFEPETNFKAWFLRIVTNVFLGERRKGRRASATLRLDATSDLYLHDATHTAGLHAEDPDPARTLLSALDRAQILAAIHALPHEYRVVATLYFVSDMAYHDMAAVLRCPIGTVRSRLHRARSLLQRSLWKLAEERGIVGRPNRGNHFVEDAIVA